MRVLILGATGRTGKLLVKEALKQHYEINVLVRNKNKLPSNLKSIGIYEGVATSREDLTTAMQGCEAIISALNISRTSDFPWAKLRTPKNFLSESIKNIISEAGQQNINRLITISAWGVSETKEEIPFWFKWLIDYSNIHFGYLEHESQEKLLKKSTLNWTAVRPTILTNSKKEKILKISFNKSPKPSLFISRQNTAKFIIDILQKDLYFNQSPTISEN